MVVEACHEVTKDVSSIELLKPVTIVTSPAYDFKGLCVLGRYWNISICKSFSKLIHSDFSLIIVFENQSEILENQLGIRDTLSTVNRGFMLSLIRKHTQFRPKKVIYIFIKLMKLGVL